MNYQNYDDYMRNTLGFSGMNQSMGMPYGGCATTGTDLDAPKSIYKHGKFYVAKSVLQSRKSIPRFI